MSRLTNSAEEGGGGGGGEKKKIAPRNEYVVVAPVRFFWWRWWLRIAIQQLLCAAPTPKLKPENSFKLGSKQIMNLKPCDHVSSIGMEFSLEESKHTHG